MRKAKTFNIGDKVFAKVKGYPAWPAKIVAEKGKKYDVSFYGTGETGSIKVEDLFYYLKHKDQFCKNLKRKDYIEAVEQIEIEIQETGTDGNSEDKDATEMVHTPNTVEKKGRKRKRSKSIDKSQVSEETPIKRKAEKTNSTPNVTATGELEIEVPTEDSDMLSELTKTATVSPKSTATSRSGRVIKLKKFNSEDSDEDKKTVKRRYKENQNEVATPREKKVINSEILKEESSVGKNLNKSEKVEENVVNKTAEEKKDAEKTPLSPNEPAAAEEETITEKRDESEEKADMDNQQVAAKDEVAVEEIENEEGMSIDNVEEQETEESEEIDDNNENEIEGEKAEEKETVEVKVVEPVEVNIVPTNYLEAVTAYANYVRSRESTYRKKPAEPRLERENEVVITKLPSGKLIGMKYNIENSSKYDSEFSRAEAEEIEAKTILSLKDLVEKGKCKPEDDPDLFVTDINISEVEIQEQNESKIIEHKKKKLKYLKTESGFVELDSKIKSCLGLDKAEPKKALEFMEAMLELEITPLMLKKHPHIADMVKRLRRYVGNIKEWNLTGDSLESFEADAEKIREKAEEVFLKFKSLFEIPEKSSFWDVFSAEVEKFKNETIDMKETEIFTLCAEPGTRQAFFDLYEEQEELQKLENEQNKKENLNESESKESASTTDAT